MEPAQVEKFQLRRHGAASSFWCRGEALNVRSMRAASPRSITRDLAPLLSMTRSISPIDFADRENRFDQLTTGSPTSPASIFPAST